MWLQANRPSTDAPSATAGLSAPPEIEPVANAPTTRVKPIATPKNELFSVSFAVAQAGGHARAEVGVDVRPVADHAALHVGGDVVARVGDDVGDEMLAVHVAHDV